MKSTTNHLPPPPPDNELHRLTPHQLDILRCRCHGMSNETIAFRFFISEHTVKQHFLNIFQRLAIHASNKTGWACFLFGLAEATRILPKPDPSDLRARDV